jgi:hypothetical protein
MRLGGLGHDPNLLEQIGGEGVAQCPGTDTHHDSHENLPCMVVILRPRPGLRSDRRHSENYCKFSRLSNFQRVGRIKRASISTSRRRGGDGDVGGVPASAMTRISSVSSRE